MKRLMCAALLASAFVVPASAQDSNSTRAQRDDRQASEKASKQKAKAAGADCDQSRAGVRCSRPKPKKVWFFGKA